MLGRFIQGANRQLINQRAAAFGTWSGLTAAPADPILGLNDSFKKDTRSTKILLGMGVYRDNDGKPQVLECVRRAEKLILDRKMDHEYSPIQGIDSYINKCQILGFGANSTALKEGRLAGAQAISGTGSLRLGLAFFAQWYPHKDIDFLTPKPTWPIHNTIGEIVGYKPKNYRYYNPATKGLDFEGLKADLKACKDHSVVMWHVCAHNPTGVDPSEAQWLEILDIVKTKKLFSAFDSAY